MNLQNLLRQQFKIFINLVYKNYQGQVAIFVALIFQIVFILFALMINVGLLIHHKINLQQSTDLAAYYGAMKQAEMLNVVGHVNFQIRQAFKLMTWRYRILGTFGFEQATVASSPANAVKFPIQLTTLNPPRFKYNSDSDSFTCAVTSTLGTENIRPTDIPFMCLAHYGFKEYPNPPNNTETFCKIDCTHFSGLPTQINDLTMSPSGSGNGWYNGTFNAGVSAINNALTQANEQLKNVCESTGPTTVSQLIKFYVNYLQDSKNKMLFIKMLMANLSANEENLLDIEGKKVLDGAMLTFRNNLTEANNTSSIDGKDGNIFQTYNSLSAAHGGDCSYPNVALEQPSLAGNATLFAEINFQFIQYFITKCKRPGATSEFSAGSIYNTSGSNLTIDSELMLQLTKVFSTNADKIKDIMLRNNYDHTIGVEKNPWCQVYYGVKATSTPIIPFLPISKVTLHASSFAKPFGGSIGPRSFKEWPKSMKKSDSTGGDSARVDRNLPVRDLNNLQINNLKDNRKAILNYSNFVGDNEGLSNPKIVAIYYDMLLNRSVGNNQAIDGKEIEPIATERGNPKVWPAYVEWNGLTEALDSTKYDPLAYDVDHSKNSFMRDIELSVVAPNQFEATYYSIEPDFYNVYVKGKLEVSLPTLKAQAGLSGTNVFIPKDFGHNDNLTGVKKGFSVRNQLEIVQHVMRGNPNSPPAVTNYSFSGSNHSENMSQLSSSYFNYVPYLPGSLLTSWTMKDLVSDDFGQVTQDNTKMPFAKCIDEDLQGNGYGAIAGSSNPAGGTEPLPPAPGNCITGGRTGYSVKIVSPAALFSNEFTVENSTDSILNPPIGFVSF